ncbi:S8 family serine peptidase [Paraconexibacter sp.]|uniref:S8 family serine peptidase n=1 Tax=Paraconexibacter sp. TaxID=2949640 RepID=UPI00356AC97D
MPPITMPSHTSSHAARAVLVGVGVWLAIGAAPAHAVEVVPGEVVVGEIPAGQTVGDGPRAVSSARRRARHRVVRVRDIDKAIRAIRQRDNVVYAVPNVKARAAGYIPNDPGRGKTPGGWRDVQWNFIGPFSVNAPEAWSNLAAVKRYGGRGVTVAVLDTGVAYRARKPFLKSPDLQTRQFVRGYDFVDRDPYPNDSNGHGTHVASTIAEQTNNGYGLTGLAYGARIMPVRVLDDQGEGDASDIADGVRFAARKGADVINLSLEFSSDVTARQIPELIDAIRYAHAKGAIIVGASGNEGHRAIAYPARAANVISVGATTERGCLSDFSNVGSGLDIVAPGGGADAAYADDPNCRPDQAAGRDIFQITLKGKSRRTFGLPGDYQGTSMAAPHVSATAALVLSSRVLGRNPSPSKVEKHLEATATDLGAPGHDSRYGAGLLNAGKATRPILPPPVATPSR